MASEHDTPDLGALAEGRIRGLLLDTTLDDEDRGYLAAFIAAFEIQTARLIAAEERATRLGVLEATARAWAGSRNGGVLIAWEQALYNAVANLDAPGESP